MSDIKIKVKPKETIKNLEKNIVGVQKIKNNLITTKEKLNEFTVNDNNSGEEYAERKVQNNIGYAARKGTEEFNKIGNKSMQETRQNIAKGKQKIDILKAKVKENKARNLKDVSNSTKMTIKSGINNGIKVGRNSIRTTERVVKNSEKIAKGNVKVTQRVIKISKNVSTKTANGIRNTTQATIKSVKAIVSGIKTMTSLIMAGGWIAVTIILIIALIGGFVAVVSNNKGDKDYDSSQITNSEIVLIAKAQLGNEGGDKFWKWYGFQEHVEWCACFVSWCADQCGYIDKEIIPKFSFCDNAISWFEEKDKWHDREESYYPIIGDIIFFDWKDSNGNQDGSSDHVGIVTRIDIDNRTVYTIEGNTSNKCAERMYSLDNMQIMGYGSPSYP